MTRGPYPLPRPVDTAVIARLTSALAGGDYHYATDRELARQVKARFPGICEHLAAARRFHGAAALRAVTRGQARGILVMGAGYPCRPDPHEAPLGAVPAVRAVYADPDEAVTAVNRVRLGGPRVSACQGVARDPAGTLAVPEVAALPRPLCVIVRMCLQYWPPDAAAAITAAWARLLPPGSFLAVSLVVPSPEAAGWLTAMLRDAGIRLWRHEPADLAGWLDRAGLELTAPGVVDVRAWPDRAWADSHFAGLAPGQIVGALARKP